MENKFFKGEMIGFALACLLIIASAIAWFRRRPSGGRNHGGRPLGSPPVTTRRKLGVRVVCISDTHGRHDDLPPLPPADILIHAGDFTHFGKRENAERLNAWIAAQSFEHVVVVNGNHEHNAAWKKQTKSILGNATFLRGESVTLRVRDTVDVVVFGTDFFWPMVTPNPYYDAIPSGTDVIVSHGPCKDMVDGGAGCETLLGHVRRVAPRLVVSGHIHQAHGVVGSGETCFVNAANCRNGYTIGWGPVVVDI